VYREKALYRAGNRCFKKALRALDPIPDRTGRGASPDAGADIL
jgi:hypothetical protein